MRKKLSIAAVIPCGLVATFACLFLVIQLVPTGVSMQNPVVVAGPAWDSPTTRALAEQACFDCHSNETEWPLYSRIAPASWVVARHVREGREALNFSEWDMTRREGEEDEDEGEAGEMAEEVIEVVEAGEMPLASYMWLHPAARLSETELQQLIEGFEKSLQPGVTP